MLTMSTSALVLAGALLTVARQTPSYENWLSILVVVVFMPLSLIRVMAESLGYLLGLFFSIGLLLGQFLWPAGTLWVDMVWQVARTLWLTSAPCVVVGFCVLPRSARDECASAVAQHLEAAGHALSGAASNLLPAAAHPAGWPPAREQGGFLSDSEGARPVTKRSGAVDMASLLAWRAARADPGADHQLRYVQGSGSKRAGRLLPALLKTRQELKLGVFEPAWWATCTVEQSAWLGILDEMDVLACYLCSLESLLEGHEPLLLEDELADMFGFNPLPCFRQVFATCAASLAGMAAAATQLARGYETQPCSVAALAQKGLRAQVADVLDQCHASWHRRHLQQQCPEPHDQHAGAELFENPLERRMLLLLQGESLALLRHVAKLEGMVAAAGSGRRRYFWRRQRAVRFGAADDAEACLPPHCAAGSSKRTGWERMKLEAEPFWEFMQVCVGKQVWDACRLGVTASLPRCWGSPSRAWHTLRRDKTCHFGLLFFVISAGTLAGLVQAAAHIIVIRVWHSFYLAVAALSTMQERADFAIVRGAWRLCAACSAAVLGYVIMLRADLADNTYGLTVLSVAGCAVAAHFFIGKLRYGAFMGSTAYLAMIFNQYSPVSGSTGSVGFYAARSCEYSIGVLLVWGVQFLFPWFLAAHVLEQVGEAAEASTLVVEQHLDATYHELQLLQAAEKQQQEDSRASPVNPAHCAVDQASNAAQKQQPLAQEAKVPMHLAQEDAEASGQQQSDLAKLDIRSVTKRVAGPLYAVQLQMAREGVVWSRGPLVMPSLVKQCVGLLQELLERTVLVHSMAKQPALIAHFTADAHTIFKKRQG